MSRGPSEKGFQLSRYFLNASSVGTQSKAIPENGKHRDDNSGKRIHTQKPSGFTGDRTDDCPDTQLFVVNSTARRSPAPIHESFSGGEEGFVDRESDHNNDENDADHLIHRMEFPAIVQELTEPEAAQDCDIDFRRHQRTPGKGPTLLHSAQQEGKGGGN